MQKDETKSAGAASDLSGLLDVFTEMPTETGMYLCSCDENNGEWCPVIIHTGKNGELMVTETIGTYQLKAYHNNLINIKWRKAIIRL
jgi:hypothetical protein